MRGSTYTRFIDLLCAKGEKQGENKVVLSETLFEFILHAYSVDANLKVLFIILHERYRAK